MGCRRAVSSCVIPASSMKPWLASTRLRPSANMNTLFLPASISRSFWPLIKLRWADICQTPLGRVVAYINLIPPGTTGDTKHPYICPALRSERGRQSMTPQERQLVDDLFDRLSKVETAPRDPDAVAAVAQGLRRAPNATYALVQTVLLQDEALKRAHDRIQELEGHGGGEQNQSGGFLDSMRDALFGQNQNQP